LPVAYPWAATWNMPMKSHLPMLSRAGKRCDGDNNILLLARPIDQIMTNTRAGITNDIY
jgi:hypothetical protein